jgi:guanine nucleotide-binding protein G(i) subunit alpha
MLSRILRWELFVSLFSLYIDNTYFPGPQTFEAASDYIKDRFVEMNENKNKSIYYHLTTATNTENISVVFNVVRDIILTKTLTKIGVM